MIFIFILQSLYKATMFFIVQSFWAVDGRAEVFVMNWWVFVLLMCDLSLVLCLCLQRVTVTFTLGAAGSTWSFTNFRGGKAEESVWTVATTRPDVTVITAKRVTIETWANPSHTGKPAKVPVCPHLSVCPTLYVRPPPSVCFTTSVCLFTSTGLSVCNIIAMMFRGFLLYLLLLLLFTGPDAFDRKVVGLICRVDRSRLKCTT